MEDLPTGNKEDGVEATFGGGWSYRVIYLDFTYNIWEVYYDNNHVLNSWCECGAVQNWETLESLKENYAMIGEAFLRPVLAVDADGRLVEKTAIDD